MSEILKSIDVTTESTDDPSHQLALIAAIAADERKAGDITLIKVREVAYITDYFLIVTGYSKAQVRAISEAIQEKVEREIDRPPLQVEGSNPGSWVLLDYGDVIVHIMLPEEREYYNLEAFWGHGEHISLNIA